jgi:hypothetical protein
MTGERMRRHACCTERYNHHLKNTQSILADGRQANVIAHRDAARVRVPVAPLDRVTERHRKRTETRREHGSPLHDAVMAVIASCQFVRGNAKLAVDACQPALTAATAGTGGLAIFGLKSNPNEP